MIDNAPLGVIPLVLISLLKDTQPSRFTAKTDVRGRPECFLPFCIIPVNIICRIQNGNITYHIKTKLTDLAKCKMHGTILQYTYFHLMKGLGLVAFSFLLQ